MTIKQLQEKLALVDCPDAEVNISKEPHSWESLSHIEINFPSEGDPYVVLY